MKIAILAYDPESSGIASYTIELAKLLKEKFDTTIVSFSPEDKTPSEFKIIKINLNFKNRAFPYLTYIINRNKIKKILDEFDIVHETLPPWGSESDRLITTRWGYVSYRELARIRFSGLSFPENLGAYPVTLQHYIMDRKSLKKAKFVISVNEDNDSHIPPPIELRPIKKYENNEILKILFVSRDLNMPRKNIFVLLETLKHLKRPVELHLIGNGKISDNFSFKIVNHGYLKRDDVFQIMYSSDILILPSIYEELGFVGLEAYSVGLPVIVSDIPSFRTVFKISPRFKPNDPIELKNILEDLDFYKIERMGKDSWNYVKNANEIALKKLKDIYNKIINKY